MTGHLGPIPVEVLSEHLPVLLTNEPTITLHEKLHFFKGTSSLGSYQTIFSTMLNTVYNPCITFYEMETLEKNHWELLVFSAAVSVCACHLHWSECSFTNGWDFHHKHPSRFVIFQIGWACLIEPLQQMFTVRVLAEQVLAIHLMVSTAPPPLVGVTETLGPQVKLLKGWMAVIWTVFKAGVQCEQGRANVSSSLNFQEARNETQGKDKGFLLKLVADV